MAPDTHQAIEAIWRIEQAKIIAGLARITRDIGIAEELAQVGPQGGGGGSVGGAELDQEDADGHNTSGLQIADCRFTN